MAERPAADELAAAKARIAELEAREAERERAQHVQAALYRIADAASCAEDLPAFYRDGPRDRRRRSCTPTTSTSRSTTRSARRSTSRTTSTGRHGHPRPGRVGAVRRRQARGHHRPTSCDRAPAADRRRSYRRARRPRARSSTLGVVGRGRLARVPLIADGRTLGRARRADVHRDETYTRPTSSCSTFVGRHVGVALEPGPGDRRDAPARTRSSRSSTRSAAPLASQLDFAAIIELVGERIRAIFEVRRRCPSRLYDRPDEPDRVPVRDRRGRADPHRADRSSGRA